jgi:maltodextrin utilization protein YvdJ
MISWINTVLFCLFLNTGYLHPVHVSISNLDYLGEQNKMALTIKVFEDDFRLLFFHLNQVEIDLKDSSNYNQHKELILAYIDTNFKLEANINTKLKLEITYWKYQEDALWFSFEIQVKDEIKMLKITNTLFLDLYFDQKNLVILKTKDKELGYQFDYKTSEKEIRLK